MTMTQSVEELERARDAAAYAHREAPTNDTARRLAECHRALSEAKGRDRLSADEEAGVERHRQRLAEQAEREAAKVVLLARCEACRADLEEELGIAAEVARGLAVVQAALGRWEEVDLRIGRFLGREWSGARSAFIAEREQWLLGPFGSHHVVSPIVPRVPGLFDMWSRHGDPAAISAKLVALRGLVRQQLEETIADPDVVVERDRAEREKQAREQAEFERQQAEFRAEQAKRAGPPPPAITYPAPPSVDTLAAYYMDPHLPGDDVVGEDGKTPYQRKLEHNLGLVAAKKVRGPFETGKAQSDVRHRLELNKLPAGPGDVAQALAVVEQQYRALIAAERAPKKKTETETEKETS